MDGDQAIMEMSLELVRDTYSRDMGTFGVLSVYQGDPQAFAVEPGSLERVDELLATKPGDLVRQANRIVDPPILLPSEKTKLFECHTVERPWANNAPNISCIPEGDYMLVPRWFYRRGYMTWEVTNVPHRSLILFHKGNLAIHVEGCIALGTRRGALGHQWAVLHSGRAFKEFIELVKPLGGIAIPLKICHRPVGAEQRQVVYAHVDADES